MYLFMADRSYLGELSKEKLLKHMNAAGGSSV